MQNQEGSEPEPVSFAELVIADQAGTQIRVGCAGAKDSTDKRLRGLAAQPKKLACGGVALATHPLIRTSRRLKSNQDSNRDQRSNRQRGWLLNAQNRCHEAINSSQNSALSAVAPTAKASHWSFRVRTTLHQLLPQ